MLDRGKPPYVPDDEPLDKDYDRQIDEYLRGNYYKGGTSNPKPADSEQPQPTTPIEGPMQPGEGNV